MFIFNNCGVGDMRKNSFVKTQKICGRQKMDQKLGTVQNLGRLGVIKTADKL